MGMWLIGLDFYKWRNCQAFQVCTNDIQNEGFLGQQAYPVRRGDRVPEGDVAIRQGLSMRSRRAMLTMTGDKAERKAHHKDHCIQTIRGE